MNNNRLLGEKAQNMEIMWRSNQRYRVIHGFIHIIHNNGKRD
jgi:hypothetical protein